MTLLALDAIPEAFVALAEVEAPATAKEWREADTHAQWFSTARSSMVAVSRLESALN